MSSKPRKMGAGFAGMSKHIHMNADVGGGSKKQGLTSRVGLNNWTNPVIQARSNGIGRNLVFRINQLGGIGRRNTMFATNADGVKK